MVSFVYAVLAFVGATGCGSKEHAPAGQELGRTKATPRDIQISSNALIINADDPSEDRATTMGPHDVLLSVPRSGGSVTEIARLPMGDMRVGPRGIAYTSNGQLAIFDPGTGSGKKAGTLEPNARDPVWIDDGVVVLANRNPSACCTLVKVSLTDGLSTEIGKLPGIGDALVTVDGNDTFMAEVSTGQIVRIAKTGEVSNVASVGKGALSCFAVSPTQIWWGGWPDTTSDHYTISTMARAGGPPTTIVDMLRRDGVECVAAGQELVYATGHQIVAVDAGKKSRTVVDSKADIVGVVVDSGNVYWAERVGKEWTFRSAPLR